MSTDALGAAITGLRVTQRGLDVVSTNIANAGTDGYTAKSLNQETIVAGNSVIGVRIGEVTRYVDKAVQRDYRTQLSRESFYSTRESYLSRIMAFHGAAEQEKSISAQLGKVYNSFVELSASPDSTGLQQTTLNRAGDLVKTINNFSKLITDMRNEAQNTIASEVEELNRSIVQIANFNKKIQSLQAVGQSTAALEDQRDVLIKNVSQQLDVTYFTDGDGTLVLQTKSGQVLADTEAYTLSFTNEALTPASSYPNSIGGILLDTTDVGIDITSTALGGRLGALITLRDQDLLSYNAQLDELAHKIATRFDDQGLRLFTNANGIVPANNPQDYNGFAGSIQLNTNVVNDPSLLQRGTGGATVNAGDNTVIRKIIDYSFGRYKDAANTLNTPFASANVGYDLNVDFSIIGDPNASLEQFARALIDSQAGDYNILKTTLTSEKQYTQELQKRLSDGSAVNTDQEMAKMIELQRTYSASAKMVNALDELFRDLLNAI